jgi:hypothetical protein
VKQGADTAAHAARCYINNLGPNESFLKIDFMNAFNAVSRDEVFRSAEEYTPELLPFIDVCYGQLSDECTRNQHWLFVHLFTQKLPRQLLLAILAIDKAGTNTNV